MAKAKAVPAGDAQGKKVLGRAARRVVGSIVPIPDAEPDPVDTPEPKRRGRPSSKANASSKSVQPAVRGKAKTSSCLENGPTATKSKTSPVKKKTPVKKTPVKKTPVKKTAPVRKPTPKKAPVKRKTPVKKSPKKSKPSVQRTVESDDESDENAENDDMPEEEFHGKIRAMKKILSSDLDNSMSTAPRAKPVTVGQADDYVEEDSDDSSEVSDADDDQDYEGGNMVLDNELFDEGTPVKDLFIDGKEEEMCEMWMEERSLYIFSEPGHRDPNHRENVLRRMATILQIRPGAIKKRMDSLRSQYQRMHREAKSGSGHEKLSDRQQEILRLCSFLRNHIKSQPSFTTYDGATPAKRAKRSLEYKSTPKVNERKKRHCMTSEYAKELEQEESHISISDLSPMKAPSLTASERGDDITPPSKTKFHRNQRLRDKQVEEINGDNDEDDFVPRRSPRSSVIAKSAAKDKGKSSKKGTTTKSAANIEVAKVKKSSKPFIDYSHASTSTDKAAKYQKTKILEKKYSVDYSNLNNLEWFEKQGATYRKEKDKQGKTKKALTEVMQEKSDTLAKLQQNVCDIGKELTNRAVEAPDNADSLWAKSLVPHLKRMPQEGKDRFMVFVLSKAFDVIAGKELS